PAGHIAGAISMPIDELQRRLGELPKDKEYVAYCRGPYCVYADRAVKVLRSSHRRARRLLEGFPEWKAAGFPIQEGAPTTAAFNRGHREVDALVGPPGRVGSKGLWALACGGTSGSFPSSCSSTPSWARSSARSPASCLRSRSTTSI